MWPLARLALRYHRHVLLVAAAISVGLACLITLLARLGMKVRVHGIHGLDLTELWVLGVVVAQSLPFAAMIAGFIMTGVESEEKRLQLLAVLPIARRQVSVYRAVLPIVPILGATALSLVILGALSLLGDVGSAGVRIQWASLTVAHLLFLVQLPLLCGEIRERRSSGRYAEGWAILAFLLLAVLLGFWGTFFVEPAALRPVLAALAVTVVPPVNIHLFERRRGYC